MYSFWNMKIKKLHLEKIGAEWAKNRKNKIIMILLAVEQFEAEELMKIDLNASMIWKEFKL